MKVQVFDDEDLKRLEDTIARALVRALRTVLKEGLIQGYTPPKAETFAEAPAPTEPLAPNRPSWAQPAQTPTTEPVFGRFMGEPQTGHEQPQEKQRESIANYCLTVQEQPKGYITVEEAYPLMGMVEATAKPSLRNWIVKGDVKAVIVRRPGIVPTKGLPGRLMVDRSQVIERNELRKQNAEEMRRRGQGRFGT